jgi:hypothetical protein
MQVAKRFLQKPTCMAWTAARSSSPAITTQSPNYGNQARPTNLKNLQTPTTIHCANNVYKLKKKKPTLSPICTKPLAAPSHPLGAKQWTPDTSPLGSASPVTSSANICQNPYPQPRVTFAKTAKVFAPAKPLP